MYKLCTLFSRYFTSFLNIFQTLFFLLSTHTFLDFFSYLPFIYFFFLSKCFYFPRLQSFRTLYVSVLIKSNLYFFLLIFPDIDTFKETYANRIRDSFAEGEVSFKIFTVTIHRTSINAAKNIYLSKTLISRRDNHGWMDTRGALSRMRNYRRKGLDRDSAVSAIIVRPFGINF